MLGKISLTDSPKTLQRQHTNLCSTTPLKCISKLHVHIYCSLFTIYLNASHICSMLLCQNIHFICMEKISQFSHFSSPDIEEIEAKWSLYINHPSIIDSRNISWMFCKYQNKYIIVFCCTNNIYNRYSKLFFFPNSSQWIFQRKTLRRCRFWKFCKTLIITRIRKKQANNSQLWIFFVNISNVRKFHCNLHWNPKNT